MKRLIALDQDEFNALMDLTSASNVYLPLYQTVNFSTGLHYVFDTNETEQVEKALLVGARAGLVSP